MEIFFIVLAVIFMIPVSFLTWGRYKYEKEIFDREREMWKKLEKNK